MSAMAPVPTRTWPGDRWPTDAEFVEWFEAADEAGKLAIAAWAIRFGKESERCIMLHTRSLRDLP